MKTVLCSALALIACVALLAAEPNQKMPKPQYDDKGQLVRPADYREWMFLSAGYGMNYSPAPGSHEMFTNVFVQRWAYDEFVNSGKWPEQSMFVIDEREAASRSSINQKGHYQTDLMGLAVEVKDSGRNPDKWAYYGFEADGKTAGAMPHGKLCRVPVRTRCGGGFPVRRLGIVVDPFIGSSGTSRQGLPDGNVLFSFRPKFPSWPGFVL